MSKTYTTIQGRYVGQHRLLPAGERAYTDRLMNLNPQYLGYYLSGRDRAEAARPC